eukprot:TRINITY_DN2415_c0_g1_i1.p1 TRINITY_DN2415_c0_g1~~TRINITY_DN2415_c0_g1_i1.p1  ORF type:complete len:795 (+),score=167.01 TRINITY_DN2415_c0_g1_i1:263-2647(+)
MPESNDAFQIIDNQGEIAAESGNNSVRNYLAYNDFIKRGLDYSVIAVLGPQSSGKSTLLNLMFGTNFAVMDAHVSRSRTTQGVWMAISKNEGKTEPVIVLDVEGTDSRERGEEDLAFERKTSLFSLALSSVLMINMWMHDIGRYNASNTALLKTVLELNLQLFQSSRSHHLSKTLLFFVIRDHTQTPREALIGIIMKDMEDIWKGISKPPDFVNSAFLDFFDVDFAPLPHKVYQPEQFLKEVSELKERFTKSHSKTVLRQDYSKDIPADGFYQFANNIWKVIKANKDLDLPTQKEMLAMYRCEEIAEHSFKLFLEELIPLKKEVEENIIENFSVKAQTLLNNCLSEYESIASRYHPETSARRKSQLSERVVSDLFEVFTVQLSKISIKSMELFQNLCTTAFPDDNGSQSSSSIGQVAVDEVPFYKKAKEVNGKTMMFFLDNAKASLLPNSDWTYKEEYDKLIKSVDKEITRLRKAHIAKTVEDVKTFIENLLVPGVSKATDKADPQMWNQIRSLYRNALESGEDELKKRLANFEIEPASVTDYLESIRSRTFELLKSKLKERTDFLPLKMHRRFEDAFTLDDQGLPRGWSKHDDVAAIFTRARKNAEVLLEKYAFLRLEPKDDDIVYFLGKNDNSNEEIEGDSSKKGKSSHGIVKNDPRVVLTIDECELILSRFHKETEAAYIQAIRDQESTVRATGVPGYIIVLILFLGFNEFVTILTNPILFILLIIGAGFAYLIFALNLSGPAIGMIDTAFRNLVSKIVTTAQGIDKIIHPPAPNNHTVRIPNDRKNLKSE